MATETIDKAKGIENDTKHFFSETNEFASFHVFWRGRTPYNQPELVHEMVLQQMGWYWSETDLGYFGQFVGHLINSNSNKVAELLGKMVNSDIVNAVYQEAILTMRFEEGGGSRFFGAMLEDRIDIAFQSWLETEGDRIENNHDEGEISDEEYDQDCDRLYSVDKLKTKIAMMEAYEKEYFQNPPKTFREFVDWYKASNIFSITYLYEELDEYIVYPDDEESE